MKNIFFNILFFLAIIIVGLIFIYTLFRVHKFQTNTSVFDNHSSIKIGFRDIDSNLKELIENYINVHKENYQIVSSKDDADVFMQFKSLPKSNEEIIYQENLIPVTNRQTITDSISLNEIKSLSDGINTEDLFLDTLVVSSDTKDQIVELLQIEADNVLVLPSYFDVLEQVSNNKNYLGLIPISKLDIQVHPLKIDIKNGLKNNDDYPMKLALTIPGKYANDPLFIHIKQYFKPSIHEILAVGDIMMGRYVGVKINNSQNDYHSVEYVSEQLSQPDITFAQLETPFAYSELTSEGMILISQPATVKALTKSGIDIVSISGNHFGDALREGMQTTFDILDQNNIKYVGGGTNEKRAFSYQTIDLEGLKYGFLSFVNIMPSSYGADENYAGSAWVDFDNLVDRSKIISSIQSARQNSDILFVGFHWGTEYTPDPTDTQQEIAHLAIDNGADMVIGTHPHVVQAEEIYHGKYINYSLGNFIMDQMWSEETQEGALLYTYIRNKKIISNNLVPTHVLDYSQVTIQNPKDGKDTLERIWTASNNLDQS